MDRLIKILRRNTIIIIVSALMVTTVFTFYVWHAVRTLDVCIAMKSSSDVFAQLFYDRGRGLNTIDSISLPVRKGADFVTRRFRLPNASVHSILFAPLNTPGSVSIKEIKILNGQNRVIQQLSLQKELIFITETSQQADELMVFLPFSYPITGKVNFFLLISQMLMVFLGSVLGGFFLLLMYVFLSKRSNAVTLLIILTGISVRLLVGLRGYNFDFDSWKIVAQISAHGGNVYAETTRYNYGPVWFNILYIFHHFASLVPQYYEVIFRYLIIGFLSLIDLGIFGLLHRKYDHIVANLFFLNPVSIIITGYHNQFENFAVLLGMYAVVLFGDNSHRSLDKQKLLGLIVLGISLMTKHVLFLFPFWIMVKQKGFFQKIAVFVVPITIFFVGFLPYWYTGKQGIFQNVFHYVSFNNEPFFRLLIPEIVRLFLTSRMVWFLLLALLAFVFRKEKMFDSLLLYTCVFLMASPAIANQYLAIVIPLVSRYYKNIFFVLYTLVGTWHLVIDADALHVPLFQSIINIDGNGRYAILVCILCFGFIWHLAANHIIFLARRIKIEMQIQFGYEERF